MGTKRWGGWRGATSQDVRPQRAGPRTNLASPRRPSEGTGSLVASLGGSPIESAPMARFWGSVGGPKSPVVRGACTGNRVTGISNPGMATDAGRHSKCVRTGPVRVA